MVLSTAGNGFLHFCAAECGHAPTTPKAYSQAVRRFREWLVSPGDGDLDIREITPSLAR